MILTRAEMLVALGKAGSSSACGSSTQLSTDDSMLLDLVMPLADATVKNYLEQDLEYQQTVEYLPIGNLEVDRDDNLADYEKINGRFVYVGNAPGVDTMQLKNVPVLLVGLEVREDLDAFGGQAAGAFDSTTILTIGVDYFLECDQPGVSRSGVLRKEGFWFQEPRCYQVTYWGGFTDGQFAGAGGPGMFAAAVKLSALEATIQTFRAIKMSQKYTGILTGERIGMYSYSVDPRSALLMAGFVTELPYSAKMRLQKFRNYGRIFA